MKEIWKKIKGFEQYYEVSNYGNVRSIDRIITDKNGVAKKLRGTILSKELNRGGYEQVQLCAFHISKLYRVHRLVAEAFIPNPENYQCVNHKDGNKLNNNINNLEWCDYKYNNNHAWINGLIKKRFGKENNRSKRVYQLNKNDEILNEYDSLVEACKAVGGKSTSKISEVCSGKRKYAYSYKWAYSIDDLLKANGVER